MRFHARWVVPVASAPIEQGTVIVEGDRIVWVGRTTDAPHGGRDEPLGEAIVTPGLVNAHTHLDLTMLRRAMFGLGFFDWVRTVAALHRDVLSDADRLDAALLGIAEGLATGITCYGDTAPSVAAFDAMRVLGVRGIAYREVFGPDPAQCGASLALLQRIVDELRPDETPLVRIGVSPHAPYSVSDELFCAVEHWAAAEQLPVAVHIAESEAESALVTRGEGPFADLLRGRGIRVAPRARSPIALLTANGLLRRDVLLIHCARLDGAEVEAVAHSGAGIAHCPVSNAAFGHAVAPIGELVSAGAKVGMGSDSMGSNEAMDLFAEARMTARLQSGRRKSFGYFTPPAIFRILTLGGAEALGLDLVIGSLVPGKQADLAIFEWEPSKTKVLDPCAALLSGELPMRATRVLVAGRDAVREGSVIGFDPSVRGRVDAATARVLEWRSTHTAS